MNEATIPAPEVDATLGAELTMEEMFIRQDSIRIRVKNFMTHLDKNLPSGENKTHALNCVNDALAYSVKSLMEGATNGR